MTYQESGKIVTMLCTAYPSMRGADDRAMVNQTALWAEMFKADSYDAVKTAVRDYIAMDDKGFPPKIGQIKAKMPTREATAIHKDWSWMKPHIDKCRANRIAKYGSEAAWEAHRREMGWTD